MKLISPGSRVKFFTVKPLNTKFQITFLSGTVQEDNGNRVTVWTDDSRTFHVPMNTSPKSRTPTIPLPISPPTLYPVYRFFDEIISVL